MPQAEHETEQSITESSFTPLGSSGYYQSGGYVHEEFLTQLTGHRGRRIYREMLDNDSTIGAVLFGIVNLSKKAVQIIEPADHPNGQDRADWLDTVCKDMASTMDAHIAEALETMIAFGFSPFEVIAKQRNGYEFGDTMRSSRYDDGTIGIADLSPRPPETIYDWILKSNKFEDYPDNGEVWGFQQQYVTQGETNPVPLYKCVHYIAKPRKGNPEGVSAFRNCYLSWYYVKHMQRIEAIAVERNLNGLPVIYIPNSTFLAAQGYEMINGTLQQMNDKDKIASATATVNEYENIVKNIRINEQGGIVFPSDVHVNPDRTLTNNPLVKIELLSCKSTGDMDIGDKIARYKQDIARTFFAQFVMLGTASASGNKALSQNLSDLFLSAVDGWLEHIAAVWNTQLLPYLWKLNETAGFEIEDMPTVKFSTIREKKPEEIAKVLTVLASHGVLIDDQDQIINGALDSVGLEHYERDEEGIV